MLRNLFYYRLLCGITIIGYIHINNQALRFKNTFYDYKPKLIKFYQIELRVNRQKVTHSFVI